MAKTTNNNGAITNAENKELKTHSEKVLAKTKKAYADKNKGKKRVMVQVDKKTWVEKWE